MAKGGVHRAAKIIGLETAYPLSVGTDISPIEQNANAQEIAQPQTRYFISRRSVHRT